MYEEMTGDSEGLITPDIDLTMDGGMLNQINSLDISTYAMMVCCLLTTSLVCVGSVVRIVHAYLCMAGSGHGSHAVGRDR